MQLCSPYNLWFIGSRTYLFVALIILLPNRKTIEIIRTYTNIFLSNFFLREKKHQMKKKSHTILEKILISLESTKMETVNQSLSLEGKWFRMSEKSLLIMYLFIIHMYFFLNEKITLIKTIRNKCSHIHSQFNLRRKRIIHFFNREWWIKLQK